MNSCQTQSLGWYIFNQSRIRTWKTKYSKVLRYPPLSVTSNPYQGLKRVVDSASSAGLYLSVTSNPYQGLKLREMRRLIHWHHLSVTSNPYQGLKLDNNKPISHSKNPFQLHLIPIRD